MKGRTLDDLIGRALFLGLVALLIPAAFKAQTPASFATDLESYLADQSAKGFSGSVLVATQGKVVLNKSYGTARASKKPVFWIASNSKNFAAVAILKLQEQGKLSVNDRITKFFNDVPPDKEAITIHHLLTHSSGLPQRYAADGIASRDGAIKAILSIPLRGPVGSGYRYTNDGYSLLAAIIEIASGTSYEEYVHRQLLRPAGLKHTGFWGFETGTGIMPVANPAGPASISSAIYKNGRSLANWGYRGASGMYSTADDLYRWLLSLQNGKVLNGSSVDLLWGRNVAAQRAENGEEFYYGYGWNVRYRGGKRSFIRHTGYEDWLGHSSLMMLFDNGDAIVVLSNSGRNEDSAWATFVGREIQARLAKYSRG